LRNGPQSPVPIRASLLRQRQSAPTNTDANVTLGRLGTSLAGAR